MTHQPHPSVTRQVVQLLAEHGFDGMAEAMERLFNECMKIERQQALGVGPYQRGAARHGQVPRRPSPHQTRRPRPRPARHRRLRSRPGDSGRLLNHAAGRVRGLVQDDVRIVEHPVFPVGFRQDDWWRWPGSGNLVVLEYNKYLAARVRRKPGPTCLRLIPPRCLFSGSIRPRQIISGVSTASCQAHNALLQGCGSSLFSVD